MSRLLLALSLVSILLLVGVFVPMGGKTAVERWNEAPSTGQFVERGWNETVVGWDRLWGVAPAPKPAPRLASRGAAARAPDPAPAEHPTDEARRAMFPQNARLKGTAA